MCLLFIFSEKMNFVLTTVLFALLANNIIADDCLPCNQIHFQQQICIVEIGNIHFVARHNGNLSGKGKQMLYST